MASAALSCGALALRVAVAREPRLFAGCYARRARRAERGAVGQRRQRLLEQASGRLLDVGTGSGEMFQHLPPAVSEVVAIDPDPFMLRQAGRRAAECGISVRFVRAASQSLPFRAATFDTAVVALVLCTVEDVQAAVAELFRVLRPGGLLLVLEHVRAADETLAQLQDLVARPWSWCNGGCRPNRDTLRAIQSGGFSVADVEWFGYPVLPHLLAVAVRP